MKRGFVCLFRYLFICVRECTYISYFLFCVWLCTCPIKLTETNYWSCVLSLTPFPSHRSVEASQLCSQSTPSCRGSLACGGGIVSFWNRVLCGLWIILISKTILWSSLLYYIYFFAFVLKITTEGIASLSYIFPCLTFVPQSIEFHVLLSFHLVL